CESCWDAGRIQLENKLEQHLGRLHATQRLETEREHKAQILVVHILFFASGFCALVYQVAYQRLLGLFAGSDSISVAIVVGAFLLGLGLGSLLAGVFVDRLSRQAVIFAFALCEFAIAAFAIASKLLFYDFLFSRMIALSADRWLVLLIAFL